MKMNQINTKQGAGFAAVWLSDFLHYSWRHTDLLRRAPALCVPGGGGRFPWRLLQTFSQEIMLRVTNQKAMKTRPQPSAFVQHSRERGEGEWLILTSSSPFSAPQQTKVRRDEELSESERGHTHIVEVGAVLAVELVEGQLVVVLPETHTGERWRLACTCACASKK